MKAKVYKSPDTLYKEFFRKGGAGPSATHYCPGCAHGVLHKLIAEVMAEKGIRDRSVFVSPVGCATFAYYYFNCSNIQAAHGRAAAVATGVSRSEDDAIVLSYQGDGDLASIGLNETIQAANRGEKLAVFFINNTVYGMTGGQMAPTTLVGEKTLTSPAGRVASDQGHPMRMCELINTLEAPVFIERVSLSSIVKIRKAKRVIEKALQIQKEGKGYAFVECLSNCPTNLRMTAEECIDFLDNTLENVFPLGNFRDRSQEVEPIRRSERNFQKEKLDEVFHVKTNSFDTPLEDPSFPKTEIRVSGFGGQGVLSLGLVLLNAGGQDRRWVSWFPSYGPEMRGGTAHCSVVLSGVSVGSPVLQGCDILIAMTRSAVQRFAGEVRPNGTILYDSISGEVSFPEGVTTIALPATELAQRVGSVKSANAVMLGALSAARCLAVTEETLISALRRSFASKPKLFGSNKLAFEMGRDWVLQNKADCIRGSQ